MRKRWNSFLRDEWLKSGKGGGGEVLTMKREATIIIDIWDISLCLETIIRWKHPRIPPPLLGLSIVHGRM